MQKRALGLLLLLPHLPVEENPKSPVNGIFIGKTGEVTGAVAFPKVTGPQDRVVVGDNGGQGWEAWIADFVLEEIVHLERIWGPESKEYNFQTSISLMAKVNG